jgi:hypothetical protein
LEIKQTGVPRTVEQSKEMAMNFRIEKKRSVVFCILDITDKCYSGYAKEICINLTDFLIHRCDLYNYDIVIGTDEDELLKNLSTDYTHAVIIAAGTSLGLSDRLFDAVEKQCREDFFIAGHIIDRTGNDHYKNGIELHQQFYIVNLTQYKELGCPLIGQETWIEHERIQFLRSKDYLFNDPKLPQFITKGENTETASVRLHGWNIINVALDNNKNIIQLNGAVRDSKRYLYYEYDHVFLTRLADIKYYQFFATNFFAGWNSDQLKDAIPFDGPVEQYATVGIGFNWIKNLELVEFTENTRVIFTDVNHNCLQFMKKMVEEWDGTDYADFYWTHKPLLPNNSPYLTEDYKHQIADQWTNFLATIDNWPALWQRVKQLTYDYVLIDYTATFNFDWLESEKKTLLNLSNLYNHGPFIAMNSLKYRIACENALLQKLVKKDPNVTVMLTARAADGFWKIKPQHYINTAGDFSYTDINELKLPAWHTNDWKHASSRPLGVV